jgi:serralysin
MPVVNGTPGKDTLNGGAADDTLNGGDGDDTLNSGNGNDSLYGGNGNDLLDGGGGNFDYNFDYLMGGLGSDTLYGGGGGDHLYATDFDHAPQVGDFDRMNGGAGFDWASFFFDGVSGPLDLTVTSTTSPTTISVGGQGYAAFVNIEFVDIVFRTGVSHVVIASNLAVGVNLAGGPGNDYVRAGASASYLSGMDGDDYLFGSSASEDLIDGGAGADRLNGGAGLRDMVSYYDSPSGVAINIANNTASGGHATGDVIGGFESISGSFYADMLIGNSDDNWLAGNGGADRIFGGAGNDILDGVAGSTLTGGVGDDHYIIHTGATIVESANAGRDSIASEVNYTLPQNFEDLSLLLLSGATIAIGNAAANEIWGNELGNIINGGAGADMMIGAWGDDIYVADNEHDNVVEEIDAGRDEIRTLVDYTRFGLMHNVENLTLLGSGNLNGNGNAAANIFKGNSGNNILDGSDGADTVSYIHATSSVIINLAETAAQNVGGGMGLDTLRNIERAVGSNFNDALFGSSGVNALSGGAGNDLINGMSGADVLAGGAGADSFVFNTALATTGVDTIIDFNVTDDAIRLENAIFTGLGGATGILASGFFHIGASAQDANDRIIYNASTGALFYDANGNAAGGVTQLAKLSAGLALSTSDFLVT